MHNSLKSNEKRIATWASKTIDDHMAADKKRRQTCMNKYGVEYNLQRPEVTCISSRPRDGYTSCISDELRAARSKNMTRLNLTHKSFKEKRIEACRASFKSEEGLLRRKKLSEYAKAQHRNGQADFVRKFFKDVYRITDLPARKSEFMKLNNPNARPGVIEKRVRTYISRYRSGNYKNGLRKIRYKDTELTYQSSYELDFLKLSDSLGILPMIQNGPVLTGSDYCNRYYQPDYILAGKYIIEIKSWWIEKLQESRQPGLLLKKMELVENLGYTFVYVKDKNYSEILNIVSTLSND